MPKQLVEAPLSTDSVRYESLAYVDAYDAVLNIDYAFVAYKETDVDSGDWRVRIRSSQTAGAVFEPEAMRLQSRAAAAQGKPFFVWGFNLEPSADEARQIEFRVHVANGATGSIEMLVRMRNADGTAAAPTSVTFPWPAS